jgi:hypothetical protein
MTHKLRLWPIAKMGLGLLSRRRQSWSALYLSSLECAPSPASYPAGSGRSHLSRRPAEASDAAFLHSLHTAMVVAGGLAIVGALFGLLVRRGLDVEPGQAAVA